MYKVIRCGSGYRVVIAVTPASATLETAEAKFFRYITWQPSADVEVKVFHEISRNLALSYFSGIADSIGFGQLPEQTFESLDDIVKFIQEKNNRTKLYLAVSGNSKEDVLRRLRLALDNPEEFKETNCILEEYSPETGEVLYQLDYDWGEGEGPAVLADLLDDDSDDLED